MERRLQHKGVPLNEGFPLAHSYPKNWILLSTFHDANYADMPSIFEMNVDLMSGTKYGTHIQKEESSVLTLTLVC